MSHSFFSSLYFFQFNQHEFAISVKISKRSRLNLSTFLQMTIHYQTLKAHDLSMTVDGVSMPMDVAITLAGVEFPPEGVSKDIYLFL